MLRHGPVGEARVWSAGRVGNQGSELGPLRLPAQQAWFSTVFIQKAAKFNT